MPTKEQILEYLKENKDYLEKELKIKKIGIFGSYAKDEQVEDSDIDLFVEAQPDFKRLIMLERMLETKFNKHVDVVRKHNNIRSRFLNLILKEVIYV